MYYKIHLYLLGFAICITFITSGTIAVLAMITYFIYDATPAQVWGVENANVIVTISVWVLIIFVAAYARLWQSYFGKLGEVEVPGIKGEIDRLQEEMSKSEENDEMA